VRPSMSSKRPRFSHVAAGLLATLIGYRPPRDAYFDEPDTTPIRASGSVAAATSGSHHDARPIEPSRTRFGTAVRNYAAQDWVVSVYLLVFFLAVLFGQGPERQVAIGCMVADLVVVLTVLFVVRSGLLKPGLFSGLLYRLALFGAVLGSFFQFQYLLPTASARSLDAQIYALDLRIFGFEPSVSWDRFVTPATTEWFAFFYYGYFILLAAHVIPFMLFARDTKLLGEFSLGIISVFCVAHVTYLVVPGFGPYAYLAPHFTHPLSGHYWWRLVKETVDAVDGRARTDIFPSLHTAAPTFLALFSYRHRASRPFCFTWMPMAFFVTQIILATMFLRWHYLIDICAGLTLASLSILFATRASRWELAWRRARRVPPVFMPLTLPRVVRDLWQRQ
jgi:hypothetical protein